MPPPRPPLLLLSVPLLLVALCEARVANIQAAKFLAPPDQVNVTAIVTDPKVEGTVRRLYLQHVVATTEPKKLRSLLEPLATPQVVSKIQLDINYLLDHPDEIVPYFTSKDADEVLLLIGNALQGQRFDPGRLTPAQQRQLEQALASGRVDNWVAQKYKNGRADRQKLYGETKPAQLPPAPQLSMEQLREYSPPFPKAVTGTGSIKVASPPQTLSQMLAMVQRWNPKSPQAGQARTFGRLDGFKRVRIPVVFHLLGYTDKNDNYLPPYNWWAERAAKHLVDQVNQFYRGTGIQFTLQQVRWNPKQYAYLNRGDLFAWQDCGEQCWADLSSRYNVQGGAVNIWVSGSFEGAFKCTPVAILCQISANGLSTVNPGANEDWKPGFEFLPTQMVYINYDRFSPDALNRPGAWEGGAVVVAHEVAHYLGLLHTFEGGCAEPSDAVSDTPLSLDPDSGWDPKWLRELTTWCQNFRQGKNPNPAALRKFRSCPNAGGPDIIDNVFNMMSYLDDVCRMAFTENQIARLQWAMKTYRPETMKKFAVNE